MSKQAKTDPELQQWRKEHPKFPGVAECIRLSMEPRTRGAVREIIHQELVANADRNLADLITAYESGSDHTGRVVLMALEDARLPSSIAFLGEVLKCGNQVHSTYAERSLHAINTAEARAILWHSRQAQ
jgi:hypothetical protein